MELVLSKDGTQAYWVTNYIKESASKTMEKLSDPSHQSTQNEQTEIVGKIETPAKSEQAELVRKVKEKITNNTITLDNFLKEKGYNRDSGIGKELVKIYNDTQDKLNKELEGLKSQVVDIAISDFNDR